MTDSLFSFCNLICSDGEESLHEKRNGELHEQCASCAGKMTLSGPSYRSEIDFFEANSAILEEECLQKIFGDLSYF